MKHTIRDELWCFRSGEGTRLSSSPIRTAIFYLLLVLLPQILWLHSSGWNVDALCESCSLNLPPRLRTRLSSESDVPSVNVTSMYEQVCQTMCINEDSWKQEGKVGKLENSYYLMNQLDFGSDGGWSVQHNLPNLSGPCNIQRRNASLSQLEFLEKYAYSEPVILEGVSDQTMFKSASSKWRLLADYGQDLITVATANTHSYYKTQMTLCEYIEKFMRPQSLSALGNETLYHFGDNDRERWAGLFILYQLPPYGLPGMEPVLSFGLAGPGTGVPFHIHGPTFAETIFGRKRWFLYPPEDNPDFHPDESTLHWVTHTLPSLPDHHTPLQCTLNPGEVYTFMYMLYIMRYVEVKVTVA